MSQVCATMVKDDGNVCGERLAVGKAYDVKLTTGIEFKGIVLAYDSNIVIFRISQDKPMVETGGSITTRMVNVKCVTSFKFLEKFNKDPLLAKNCCVDLDGLLAKEEKAIGDVQSRDVGVGVTKEAQRIFNGLSKTFPVKWEKEDIVVMGVVRVCSPYSSDRVTGGNVAANNRVKRELLKLEREELKLSSGKEGK